MSDVVDDDELVPQAIDRVLKRSSEVGFDKLTDAEKTFLCTVTVDFEILNGGFSAFYYNSEGEIVAAAPDALDAIGAAQSAAVVRQANALFPGGVPAHDRAERYEQIERIFKSRAKPPRRTRPEVRRPRRNLRRVAPLRQKAPRRALTRPPRHD